MTTEKRIAFLADANVEGVFAHVPLDWENWNGVEAIAAAIGAEVWHGRELDEICLNHFAAYDLVIVNLNPRLWKIVARLARVMGREKLAVLQEGPGNLPATLSAEDYLFYTHALNCCGAVFVYDERAIPIFEAVCSARVHYLPVPAPLDVYAQYVLPRTERNLPSRIAICSPTGVGRNALLSAAVASKLWKEVEIFCQASNMKEASALARVIAAAGAVPDLHGWLPWKAKGNRLSFIERLATCALAINLDPSPCYGRFVVDCAGLGVPCIGSSEAVMQNILFPDLAVHAWQDVGKVKDLFHRAIRDTQSHITATLGSLTPDSTRAAFSRAFPENKMWNKATKFIGETVVKCVVGTLTEQEENAV